MWVIQMEWQKSVQTDSETMETLLATKEEKVSWVYIWDISGVKVRDLCATTSKQQK